MITLDVGAINGFKKAAADSAATQLEDGMIVGLGSGSTATYAVAAIGRRVAQGLKIIAIPTSEQSANQARLLKIPLSTLDDYAAIDLTIDGADEVEEGTLNLIKGGGGNLLREKIVAIASARMIVVVDERKLVGELGIHGKVPVEVVPFGWKSTSKRVEQLGARTTLRLRGDGEIFRTNGGHYILDCAFGMISSSRDLQTNLDSIVGVIEHGLFLGIARQVVVGGAEGVRILDRDSDA